MATMSYSLPREFRVGSTARCAGSRVTWVDGHTLSVERNNFADDAEQEYEAAHRKRILSVVTASRWTHVTTAGVDDDE
jgi:hypothetical protein